MCLGAPNQYSIQKLNTVVDVVTEWSFAAAIIVGKSSTCNVIHSTSCGIRPIVCSITLPGKAKQGYVSGGPAKKCVGRTY